jgi:hypothetical protein
MYASPSQFGGNVLGIFLTNGTLRQKFGEGKLKWTERSSSFNGNLLNTGKQVNQILVDFFIPFGKLIR